MWSTFSLVCVDVTDDLALAHRRHTQRKNRHKITTSITATAVRVVFLFIFTRNPQVMTRSAERDIGRQHFLFLSKLFFLFFYMRGNRYIYIYPIVSSFPFGLTPIERKRIWLCTDIYLGLAVVFLLFLNQDSRTEWKKQEFFFWIWNKIYETWTPPTRSHIFFIGRQKSESEFFWILYFRWWSKLVRGGGSTAGACLFSHLFRPYLEEEEDGKKKKSVVSVFPPQLVEDMAQMASGGIQKWTRHTLPGFFSADKLEQTINVPF